MLGLLLLTRLEITIYKVESYKYIKLSFNGLSVTRNILTRRRYVTVLTIGPPIAGGIFRKTDCSSILL